MLGFHKIFLCIEASKNSSNYQCKEFDSFKNADDYYYKNKLNDGRKSTLIAICKYYPSFLENYFITQQLRNIFILSTVIKNNLD